MRLRRVQAVGAAVLIGVLAGCSPRGAEPITVQAAPAPGPDPAELETTRSQQQIRLTGVVEAVRSSRVLVPQLTGQTNRLTLTRLIANGVRVNEGDMIAEFDPLEQMDAARTARAQFEDLSHQVNQKEAQNRAEAEKRRSDLQQAEADLSKALLEVSKAEILPQIQRDQNQIRAEIAREHVASLKVSQASRDKVDAAALRILELQRDRQKVALERAERNIQVMQVQASIPGMVAHSVQYRNGSMTHAQEGDQLYRGQPLVSIFDPSAMLVRCSVGEPDRVALEAGAKATVYLDAYPNVPLAARFEAASPVATAALGSPIKTFTAIFRLEQADPRLMPDLSAAVVIDISNPGAKP